MTTTATSRLDYPALEGRTVTEGHAQLCRDHGHATYVRNGVDQGTCPRCGDVTTPAGAPAEPITDEDVWAVFGVGPHTMTAHHRGKYRRHLEAKRLAGRF